MIGYCIYRDVLRENRTVSKILYDVSAVDKAGIICYNDKNSELAAFALNFY